MGSGRFFMARVLHPAAFFGIVSAKPAADAGGVGPLDGFFKNLERLKRVDIKKCHS